MTCAKLWHARITLSLVRGTHISSRFWLWAHKPFVKYIGGLIHQWAHKPFVKYIGGLIHQWAHKPFVKYIGGLIHHYEWAHKPFVKYIGGLIHLCHWAGLWGRYRMLPHWGSLGDSPTQEGRTNIPLDHKNGRKANLTLGWFCIIDPKNSWFYNVHWSRQISQLFFCLMG